MTLRVAGVQIPVTDDISDNSRAIQSALDFARESEADILLTPEGSLSGYTHEFDQQQTQDALADICEQAKTAGIGLALGTCYVEDDGEVYNQIRFYDKDGVFLGFHSKILRCGTPTNPPIGEINHYAMRPLQTYDFHGLTIGGLICNDMWANPTCTPMPDEHLTQQLSDMGAQVIFHAVNGGRDAGEWSRNVNWAYHESNLRMRARSGKLWMVTVDNCDPIDIPCSAPSGVLDPEGNWAYQATDTGKEYFIYDLPIETAS